MMDKWGRRRVLQICVLPLTLGWVLIAVAHNHALILAGRILAGLAVGLSAAPGQVITNAYKNNFSIPCKLPFESSISIDTFDNYLSNIYLYSNQITTN